MQYFSPCHAGCQKDTVNGSTVFANCTCIQDLSHVYMYQKLGPFIIMGDFNSRCGDAQDYIEGVDSIGDRDIVDRTVNDHGEQVIQFLISANLLIVAC